MFKAYFKAEKREPQILFFKRTVEEPNIMEFKGEEKKPIKFKINKNFKLGIEN